MAQRFVSHGQYAVMLQRALQRSHRRVAQMLHAAAPAAAVPVRQLSNSAIRRAPAAAAPSAASSSATSALYTPPAHVTQTSCGLFVDRSLPANFKKVLIANRGEIACRVIRTCRELGVRTVAVYSDADAQAQHVQMADEAYRLGEAPAAQSYLLGDKIIAIAKACGAEAIHPGYGFLSENAGFARKCEQAGVEFIGPPTAAIEAMGSKSASKIIMTNAGVPVVPGYHGEDQSPARLQAEADKCGYPIMLKAVLGGGGKGMRIVRSAAEFPENLEACKREALKSFGDERVLLERYIERPRHIEFQVFADKHGSAVHFCERDCSVQRRHQKVLEEAPAPGMSEELRRSMGQAAVDAAKAVGYVGAGTVEFIFDAETDEFFFMEMNTRLQVEHPVTEMIVKKDLVQLQLHVAAGHQLPVQQEEIRPYGHAIEARVYAENPNNNFLPATGKLAHLSPPAVVPGALRVESGVRTNDEVSIFYDPMISKLCVWGRTRDEALDALATGLRQYQVVGPPTNIPFLLKSVNHPAFRKGKVETGFIAQNMKDLLPIAQPGSVNHVHAAFAVLSLLERERAAAVAASTAAGGANPWSSSSSLRLNDDGSLSRRVTLLVDNYVNNEGEKAEEQVDIGIRAGAAAGEFTLTIGKETVQVKLLTKPQAAASVSAEQQQRELYATVGSQAFHATVVPAVSGSAAGSSGVTVFVDGAQTAFRLPEAKFSTSGAGASHGCAAPMAGKVVKVSVEAGASVKKGQPLVIMEAMKMEHVLRAPADGKVKNVLFAAGDFVEGGKTVVTFEE